MRRPLGQKIDSADAQRVEKDSHSKNPQNGKISISELLNEFIPRIRPKSVEMLIKKAN
jgi:hypothetical protein